MSEFSSKRRSRVPLKAPGFLVRSSYSAAFSSSGDHLAVAGRNVSVWNVGERRRLHSTSVLSHPSSATFSPYRETYTIKNTLGHFAVCRTGSGQCIDTFLPPERDEGADVFATPDGLLVDGSWNGEIRVRTEERLTPEIIWRDEHRMVTHISPSPTTWAFLASARHTHPQFETAGGADILLLGSPSDLAALRILPRTWRDLRGLAVSPDGTRLAIRHGARDAAIEILDTATAATLSLAEDDPGGTGYELAWTPDGSHVVVVCKGRFVLRETGSLAEVGTLPSPYPSCVVFSGDGRLVFLGDRQQGTVWSWPVLLRQMSGSVVSRTEPLEGR